eukprot:2217882-Pyramimonas_sp.AAC.1
MPTLTPGRPTPSARNPVRLCRTCDENEAKMKKRTGTTMEQAAHQCESAEGRRSGAPVERRS